MEALLIIDVQNDYFSGGKSELVGADRALEQTKKVLTLFRDKSYPVIHVQHINIRPGATFFLPDTLGCEIHADITPLDSEFLVIKQAPNSFYQTDLSEILQAKDIHKLVVCGMMTHMCVDTTVRAAKDYGLAINLLYDGCATKDLTLWDKHVPAHLVHDSYMAGLAGMFANIQMADEVSL